VSTLQTTVPVPFTVSWDWDLCLKKCKIAEKYFLLIYSEFVGDITGTGYRFVFTRTNKKFLLSFQKTKQRIKNPIFALIYPGHRSGLILKFTCLIGGMREGIGLILFFP